jgi:Fic family protein
MKSFQNRTLETMRLPSSLVVTLGKIREHKGRQDLFKKQQPQVFERLRENAVIASVESSNRIENVTAPPERLRQLVNRKTEPRNRPEAEIAGYRDVLETIHVSAQNIPCTTSVVLQFHRDLYRFLEGRGGYWKHSENTIMETGPDGKPRVRFQTTPAFETAAAMELLHGEFNKQWNEKVVDRLILIPAYILDFLCIHPFPDGNGRMSRLLGLLLLYHDGIEVGRFISLEQHIESTKDGYYDSLWKSSQGWHQGEHDPLHFIDYFLSTVLLPAYESFASKVNSLSIARGSKSDAVMSAVEHCGEQFKVSDIERACPAVSRATINLVLRDMRVAGKIKSIKAGRDAVWEKQASGTVT